MNTLARSRTKNAAIVAGSGLDINACTPLISLCVKECSNLEGHPAFFSAQVVSFEKHIQHLEYIHLSSVNSKSYFWHWPLSGSAYRSASIAVSIPSLIDRRYSGIVSEDCSDSNAIWKSETEWIHFQND